MIQIHTDRYTVDLHMSEAEAGILLENALDLMETRGQRGPKTEILPETIHADMDVDHMGDLVFTSGEWMLIAKMTGLLRDSGILPDLQVKAYSDPHNGERGIELVTEMDSLAAPLPPDCGLMTVLKEFVDTAWLLLDDTL